MRRDTAATETQTQERPLYGEGISQADGNTLGDTAEMVQGRGKAVGRGTLLRPLYFTETQAITYH